MSGFVVGGGIVGLTTALMLHRSNVEVRVFEEAPKIKEFGVGLIGEANVTGGDVRRAEIDLGQLSNSRQLPLSIE